MDPSRAAEGSVTLNGAPLEFGTDWQLVDNDTIELLGGSCDTLRNTDNVELQAEFPCGVIVL